MNQLAQLSTGVYFIYAPNQNKIKIGRSVNIETRYIQLKTGFMDKGVLLIGIRTKNEVKLEKELHNKFSHLRDNGEWFILTKELKDFIFECETEYENVVKYNDFNEIEKGLSYKTLGMFNLVIYLKNIQNKIAIPSFLAIAGLIIAIYNHKIEATKPNNEFMQNASYLHFLLFPFLTPFIAKQIISYQSVRTGIFFFVYITLILIIEFLNLLTPINIGILTLIRILFLSIYIPFIKHILMTTLAKRNEERLLTKVKTEFNQIKLKNLTPTELINLSNSIIDDYNKVTKQLKDIINYTVVALFIYINFHILFISTDILVSRVVVLSIIDVGALIWIAHYLLLKNDRYIRSRNLIIPIALFLANMLAANVFGGNLFLDINCITGVGILIVAASFFITHNKRKKYEHQLSILEAKKSRSKR